MAAEASRPETEEGNSQSPQKEANLCVSPPAGKSSLTQIINSPCYPQHGCLQRVRAEQRSCLEGRKKWSERRRWPCSGHPWNLNNTYGEENGRGEEMEKILLNMSDWYRTIIQHERKTDKNTTEGINVRFHTGLQAIICIHYVSKGNKPRSHGWRIWVHTATLQLSCELHLPHRSAGCRPKATAETHPAATPPLLGGRCPQSSDQMMQKSTLSTSWGKGAKSLQLCTTLQPHDCSPPVSSAHGIGFSRQEHWSGLPCPPPGNLPDLGIESASPVSTLLVGEFFTTSAIWETPGGKGGRSNINENQKNKWKSVTTKDFSAVFSWDLINAKWFSVFLKK